MYVSRGNRKNKKERIGGALRLRALDTNALCMYICIPVGYIYCVCVYVSSSSFSLFPLCVVQLKAQPKKKKIPITLDSFTIPRDYNKRRMFAMAVQGARGPSRNDFFLFSSFSFSFFFFSLCVCFPIRNAHFCGPAGKAKAWTTEFFFSAVAIQTR